MGEMADMALEHTITFEEQRSSYRVGEMTDQEAYDAGIIDELGYEIPSGLMSNTDSMAVAKVAKLGTPHLPGPEIEPMLALVERATRDQTVDVEKMEKLLAMAERLQAKRAESEYDQAMNAAQSEMQPVARDSDNPQTRSRYVSYGALDRAVRPIYTAHGFSLSFGTRATGPDRVTITCRVSHRAGHTERVEIEMPADGKGAKGGDVQTKTHATGSAVSYGMRYLLKMIFNIAVGEYDDDGNAAGARKPVRPVYTAPKPASPASQPTKAPSEPAGKGLTAVLNVLNAFQERCKAKLVEKAQSDPQSLPYWQRYASDKGWILPNEPIDRILGNVTQVFVLDRARDVHGNSAAVQEQFLAHEKAVKAMMEEAAMATIEERAEPPSIAGHKDKANLGCPNCGHKDVGLSKEFDGILECQACKWQWDVETGDYFEEHEWEKIICPIPPPGVTKKEYDQQPMTLGQLFRTDSKRAYGLCMNNSEAKAKLGRDFKGKHYPPSNADIEFGRACDQAKFHMEQNKNTGEDSDPDTNAPF
jgi:ribosomal protein L37AE/L43A